MNFDLNINNYTRAELIDMLELPLNFDKNTVEIKESQLREKIINNKDLNQIAKSETVNFLVKAKNIILNNGDGKPTSFQKKTGRFL